MSSIRTHSGGFTLVEVLVGTSLFLIVAAGVYGTYASLLKLANASQAHILAVELADEQFEIVRNMPYTNVGLTNGIPLGVLPQTQTLSRGGFTFTVTLVVRNVDLATSTLQASSKLVEVDIACASCDNFAPISLSGGVSPANLQSAAAGGALVVQVFDSGGVPIEGATVVIQSTATSSVTDTDVTNRDGVLEVIGVPPGANVYRITATKQGYSTDRTYPIGGGGNPNPTIPDATVLQGQVTQVSLSIDKLSAMNLQSVSPTCVPVGNFHFNLVGGKQIGQGVPKYSQSLMTDGGGSRNLSPMEWDTYAVMPTDSTNNAAGITPFSPVTLHAGATSSVQIVAVPASPNSLLVAVEDNVAKLPISMATVELSSGGGYDETKMTGQGYFNQTDWSGGSGQATYSSPNRYWGDDGNIDTATSAGSVLLKQSFGSYSPSGRLESSTFDTGTTSNFYALSWKPLNQPPLSGPASAEFQFATAPSTSPNGPWTYLGPDGTPGTYYTAPGTQISVAGNGNEFARYMIYLSTVTATVTPSVSDTSFTYTSGCIPPGQVLFQGLSTGPYTLTVSKSGYTAYSGQISIGSGWQSRTIELSP
jgi:prepilin-type N-terminal cleavage/methylation domain-containing protein